MITNNKLKILCLCKGGLVRSVALKKFIVYNYDDTDVLAAGGLTVQQESTRMMLLLWSEIVFVLSGSAFKALSKAHPSLSASRFQYIPIGSDIWNDPSHPDLVAAITQYAEQIDQAIKALRLKRKEMNLEPA